MENRCYMCGDKVTLHRIVEQDNNSYKVYSCPTCKATIRVYPITKEITNKDTKKIVHYFINEEEFFGYVGTPTKMVDAKGKPLSVGDIVEVYSNLTGYAFKSVVVYNEGKYFIMGIMDSCSDDGDIDSNWKPMKLVDYSEIETNGTAVDVLVERRFMIK